MKESKKFTLIQGGLGVGIGSFFSISHKLVLTGQRLPYDLYINSSSAEAKDRFVRIFAKDGILNAEDPEQFQKKYHQLYVSESERSVYLKSLCKIAGKNEQEKTTVIKDSAISYLGHLFDQERELTTEAFNEAISGCRDAVEGLVDVLQGYNLDNLQDLIGRMSFHDFYTYDHSINVSMYCILIYRSLKPRASREEIINAGFGGMLHDLGKIKISTHIINKPGKLSPDEFAEIQKHPALGYEILSESGIILPKGIDLALLKNVVYQHHEHFDGTGYPRKIAGEQIDLYARVTAIADFFDAITTKRAYHDVLSTEEALAVMRKTCGKKIDPTLFEFFVKQTSKFSERNRTTLEVAPNFDPCQPPSQEMWGKKSSVAWDKEEPPKDYGKIVIKPVARRR